MREAEDCQVCELRLGTVAGPHAGHEAWLGGLDEVTRRRLGGLARRHAQMRRRVAIIAIHRGAVEQEARTLARAGAWLASWQAKRGGVA
ncbi:hypothetical protein I6A60_31290 [Frankia sp. AgB1.9]|uniref:hypothetical protein n=1 Tax=unclassified Frankia TaxID=2632575 RepID=UPI001A391303|nr:MULTISPECIES: hypothetical protein [unclassified Frankia]MBL7493886.1 hypothetical protein [Frankia sp. AgW1.1]MBL7552315.1 hypothetical protein [Frankia sp. AgB1.9]MBL7622068.1 hypothetical protein [Frankia sp. AgB1.8]